MARERYLVGVEKEDLQAEEARVLTGKEKRKNWWYYHKFHVLAAAVLIAVAASWIYTAFLRPKPDYSIGLITSFSIPDEVRANLEDHIAQYADDRNGDGKVMVDVITYNFGDMLSSSDYEAMQASFTRFAGDAAMGTCMIYFHNPEALAALGDNVAGFFQYNDGSPMPEEARDYTNAQRPWADFAGLADFQSAGSEMSNWTPEVVQELCSRLSVSVRTREGSNIEGDEKMSAYYDDCLALLDRLESGERPAQAAE